MPSEPTAADREKARETYLKGRIPVDVGPEAISRSAMMDAIAQALADEREAALDDARQAILPRLRHLKELTEDAPVLEAAVEAASWFLRDLDAIRARGTE